MKRWGFELLAELIVWVIGFWGGDGWRMASLPTWSGEGASEKENMQLR